MEYCSPDRLHGKHPIFACDMWSYMVIFGVLISTAIHLLYCGQGWSDKRYCLISGSTAQAVRRAFTLTPEPLILGMIRAIRAKRPNQIVTLRHNYILPSRLRSN